MAIRIIINNEERRTEALNISALAAELELPERGVALAVNNKIQPRAEWAQVELHEGDQVTIIKAAFGG